MPMIICPECAKRITNNVEKCPNCECTKDKFVTLMDRKEQDLIMLRLGKYQVRFNGKYWNYIQLRRVYELNARQLRRQLRSVYDRTTDFGSIINSFPHIVEIKMKQMLEWSMKLLYECKIPMTAEVFLDKYLEKNHYYVGNWRYYHLDYNEIINEIIEQHVRIADNNVAISELKNSVRTQQRLIDGAYHVILAIFYAVLSELLENESIDTLDYKQERENEAMNIHTTTMKYETDDKKIMIGCLNAITKYPYYTPPYGTLYEKYKKTPEEASIYHFLDFFGINAKIGETTVAKYMKVDHLLEQWVDLSKFDFDKLTADQYYEAKQAIGKVQEEFLKSEYMASANCSRLYDYILKCEISDVSKDESTEEKQAPMEEYIPLLIKRHTDEHSLGGYKDCMWVAGTEMQGPFIFKNDLQEVYDKKFIEEGKKYLLIYDNGNFFYGKDGFGIFDVGMVFFTTGKIFLFKDIVGCSFNEEKFSLIIKSVQDSYEFEYKKRSKVLFKSLYNKPGYFFTEEVIYKIIEHYQKLNGINLLKK